MHLVPWYQKKKKFNRESSGLESIITDAKKAKVAEVLGKPDHQTEIVLLTG